jgi:hypothetical protein
MTPDVGDGGVGPPPFRSGPWPSQIRAMMTAQGMSLHVHLPAEQLRELADAAGDGKIAVHIHTLDVEAEAGAK